MSYFKEMSFEVTARAELRSVCRKQFQKRPIYFVRRWKKLYV